MELARPQDGKRTTGGHHTIAEAVLKAPLSLGKKRQREWATREVKGLKRERR